MEFGFLIECYTLNIIALVVLLIAVYIIKIRLWEEEKVEEMATTVHVQNGPVVIPPQQSTQHLSTIKCLAITQLIIGILTTLFGIAVVASLYTNTWTTNTAAGIWAGGWIAITGIIGVCTVRSTASNINGVYLAFSIISTCASALAGLFFILALVWYGVTYCHYNFWGHHDCSKSYRSIGLGLHIPLLILMIVEFFISIIAAVYACQRGCGGNTQTGVIIQSAQPVHVVSSGQPGQPGTTYYQMTPSQPPVIGGQVVSGNYAGYVISQPPPYNAGQPAGQPAYVIAQNPMQTNVAYSQKPPDYSAAPPAY